MIVLEGRDVALNASVQCRIERARGRPGDVGRDGIRMKRRLGQGSFT